MLKFNPLEYLRSLCFGGVLGYAVGCYLYIKFPSTFQPHLELNTVALIGAGLGAGLYRFIDAIFIKSIFHPIMEFVSFYERIIEIHLARNLINEDERKAILSKLMKERFLGKEEESFLTKFLNRVLTAKSPAGEYQDKQKILRHRSENKRSNVFSRDSESEEYIFPKNSENEEYDDTDS